MIKSLVLVLTSLTFAAIGQISLKQGVNKIGSVGTLNLQALVPFIVKALSNPLIIVGFLLYGLASFLWLLVLSRENLSFVYPFASLTFVFVMVLSALFLKEEIRLLHWIGSFIIITGLVIITRT